MRKFAFRLEKLLELRKYRERVAEAALAEKAGACALLERALEENARSSMAASRDKAAPGRTIFDLQAAELYLRRLAIERERTIRALALAEAERETARLAYIEKSREKKIIEKLKERRGEEYALAAGREEVKAMDDIARNRIPVAAGTAEGK